MNAEKPPRCPYCKRPASILRGDMVYPNRKDLHDKLFWACQRCKAWVPCKPGTRIPDGPLANEPTRHLRRDLYDRLNALWMAKVEVTGVPEWQARKDAVEWIAHAMHIKVEDFTISTLSMSECKKAISICVPVLDKLRAKGVL